ncbi:MAG: cysteine desulfurase family protein [Collinsella sp.]|nr:cysteine desulfurase family protein [Collinsella sp.]
MAHEDTPYIYADNAATTPLSPIALEAMMPYLTTSFGNPSGIHRVSRDAANALAGAREQMAALIGAERARDIHFTSGGSESDNWVLRGAVRRHRALHGCDARTRIVTSTIEHHAILHCCDALEEEEGVEVVRLPVDSQGFVDPRDLEEALRGFEEADRVADPMRPPAPACALVSIMLANNEVGTIQDVAGLVDIAHRHSVPFHTDAVQAVGHIPLDIGALGVDALSLSAHKFHGPRGVGALYLAEGFSIPPLIAGGAQERGVRAGTENLAGIVGMVAALAESTQGLAGRARRVAALRDTLTERVVHGCDGVVSTGPIDRDRRLPSIASFVCEDVDGELLVVLLDRAGVAAATGSACSTGSTEPSHVASALGLTKRGLARGTLRLSLSDDTTPEDVDLLCERVCRCVRRARLLSGTRV